MFSHHPQVEFVGHDLLYRIQQSRELIREPPRIFIFGYVFASLFLMTSTIRMAVGKPQIAMSLAFLMIGLDFVLNYSLIPMFGLTGAALATSMTGFAGALGGLAYVFLRFEKRLNPIFLVKTGGASICISVPCVFFHITGGWLLIYYTVMMIVYVVLEALLKEVGQDEWLMLKRAVFACKTK